MDSEDGGRTPSCGACGTEVPASAKFCPECGERQRPSTLSEEEGTVFAPGATPSPLGPPTDHSLFGDETRLPEDLERGGTEPDPTVHFEILDEIGRGGMGVVYRARDTRLGRVVALKRLHEAMARREHVTRRFQTEARAVASLNHLNIVTVHDMHEDEDGLYIAMEFIEGPSLEKMLADAGGPLPEEEAVSIFHGILQGVAHAHRKGVIHRDVKPSNILIAPDGNPKLVDFGLARIGRTSSLSVSGYGMGTLDYTAPEQKRSARRADHRADIYSLACTFYEMLTGIRPPPHPESIPDRWAGLIIKATRPDPADRFFSVEEMLSALEEPEETSRQRTVVLEPGSEGTCASCRTINDPNDRYCRECGDGLFADCPACGEESQAGIKHCTHCGASPAAVVAIRDHLDSARRHLEDRRSSRALKELDALADLLETSRLGKADDLPAQAAELRAEAEQRSEEVAARWAEGEELEDAGDFAGAGQKYREAADMDHGLIDREKEQAVLLQARVLRREEEARLAQARARCSEGRTEMAHDLLQTEFETAALETDRLSLIAEIEEAHACLDRWIETIREAIDAGDLAQAGVAEEEAGASLRFYSLAEDVRSSLASARERRQQAEDEWRRGEEAEEIGDRAEAERAYCLAAELDGLFVDRAREKVGALARSARREEVARRLAVAREALGAGCTEDAREQLMPESEFQDVEEERTALLEEIASCHQHLDRVVLVIEEALRSGDLDGAQEEVDACTAALNHYTPAVEPLDRLRQRQRIRGEAQECWNLGERAEERGDLAAAGEHFHEAALRDSHFAEEERAAHERLAATARDRQAEELLGSARKAFEQANYDKVLRLLQKRRVLLDEEDAPHRALSDRAEAARAAREAVLERIAACLTEGRIARARHIATTKLGVADLAHLEGGSHPNQVLAQLFREVAVRRRRRWLRLAAGSLILAIVAGVFLSYLSARAARKRDDTAFGEAQAHSADAHRGWRQRRDALSAYLSREKEQHHGAKARERLDELVEAAQTAIRNHLELAEEALGCEEWGQAEQHCLEACAIAGEMELQDLESEAGLARARLGLEYELSLKEARQLLRDGDLPAAEEGFLAAKALAERAGTSTDPAEEGMRQAVRQQFEKAVATARELAAGKRWSEAEASFQNAATIGLRASIDIAEVQARCADMHREVIEEARRAAARQEFESTLADAESLNRARRWGEAIPAFERAIAIAEAEGLSLEQATAGIETARENLAEETRRNTAIAEYRRLVGVAAGHFEAGRWSTAEAAYRKAEEFATGAGLAADSALSGRARAREAREQAERRQALANHQARQRQAESLLQTGRWAEAERAFDAVIATARRLGLSPLEAETGRALARLRTKDPGKYRRDTLRPFEKLLSTEGWQPASPAVNAKGMREAVHRKTGLKFILVPGGSFEMGENQLSLQGRGRPVHRVTLGPFLLSATECTQSAWAKCGGKVEGEWQGPELPVGSLSWKEAREWSQGVGLRLPSESEWEYAARAGTTGSFYFMADPSPTLEEVENVAPEYEWFEENSGGFLRSCQPHPVAQLKPNPWGFYDFCGNHEEWCEDVWQEDYVGKSRDGSPRREVAAGYEKGQYHVVRGVRYSSGCFIGRTDKRDWCGGLPWTGFRPAADLPR